MYYYKHHIGDFRSGTANMTRQERWLYRDMLDVYYDKEQPLPVDIQDVCDSIGATEDEAKSIAKILRLKFNQSETGWVHERCETELNTYRDNAETARNNGKLGGRPRKNNPAGSNTVASGMQDGTQKEPDCNPEESGSQANHKPLTNNHKPLTKQDKAPPAGDADLFPGVDPQVVSDFKALRKSKKAPVTKTAMDKITAEAEKAGMSLDAALRVCCSRGWQGFNAEWVAGKQTGQPVQQKTSRHAGFEHIDYSEGIEDGRIT